MAHHQQQQKAAFTAPGWPSVLPKGDVFRQVAFPVKNFDYLKQFQRGYEAKHGVRLTNNQTLAVIMDEHRTQNSDINGVAGNEQS